MNLELVRIAVAVLGCLIAAWQDARTSFIDDRILWAMIAVGIVLDIATFDAAFLLPVLLVAAVIAGIGYLLYRSGQFGSGDVMLFLGVHLLLPYYPASFASAWTALPVFFSMPFVLSVFIASSFFASVGSAAYYAYRLSAFRKALGGKTLLFALLSCGVLLAVAALPFGLAAKAILSLVCWSLVFNLLFRTDIMDLVVVRHVRLSEVEDEDILVLDRLPEHIVKKYGLERVLTKVQVERLREVQKTEGLRAFPVCKSLPRFGPYVFAALIACLIVGDLLFFAFLR